MYYEILKYHKTHGWKRVWHTEDTNPEIEKAWMNNSEIATKKRPIRAIRRRVLKADPDRVEFWHNKILQDEVWEEDKPQWEGQPDKN